MALESATYISDLVSTNPNGLNTPVSELDNHVQLIKSTIKATFPNITGAVTPTHTELNYVDGVTSAIQTQLNAKAAVAQEAATAATLLNSWVDYGAPYQACEYWKDTLGNVHIHGVIKSGTSASVAFTLPVGYRPAATQDFFIRTANSVNPDYASIASNGDVTITGAGLTIVSLCGITFRAA